MKYNKK
jgi:hypothetical protein